MTPARHPALQGRWLRALLCALLGHAPTRRLRWPDGLHRLTCPHCGLEDS